MLSIMTKKERKKEKCKYLRTGRKEKGIYEKRCFIFLSIMIIWCLIKPWDRFTLLCQHLHWM